VVTGALEEPDDGLKVWGYMPGHVHYKVGAVDDVRRMRIMLLLITTDACNKGPARKDSPAAATVSNAVDKVLHAVPPRTITGVLLHLLYIGSR
jgi:coenzyme F420-reducing hydrogenase delta subunit